MLKMNILSDNKDAVNQDSINEPMILTAPVGGIALSRLPVQRDIFIQRSGPISKEPVISSSILATKNCDIKSIYLVPFNFRT